MQPFKYKPPRVKTGDLRTPVIFHEYTANEGPEPGEYEKGFSIVLGPRLIMFG